MSVLHRLHDAQLLASHGHVEGALLSACVAIAATSRKRFPVDEVKGDRDAFARFLGEEMPAYTRGVVSKLNIKHPDANLQHYPEGLMPFEDLLYKFVRNSLAHEGRLASTVRIKEGMGLRIEVTAQAVLLEGEVLQGLMRVCEYAPENASDFPEIAAMPLEVAGWHLFGVRREHFQQYLQARQNRLSIGASV